MSSGVNNVHKGWSLLTLASSEEVVQTAVSLLCLLSDKAGLWELPESGQTLSEAGMNHLGQHHTVTAPPVIAYSICPMDQPIPQHLSSEKMLSFLTQSLHINAFELSHSQHKRCHYSSHNFKSLVIHHFRYTTAPSYIVRINDPQPRRPDQPC